MLGGPAGHPRGLAGGGLGAGRPRRLHPPHAPDGVVLPAGPLGPHRAGLPEAEPPPRVGLQKSNQQICKVRRNDINQILSIALLQLLLLQQPPETTLSNIPEPRTSVLLRGSPRVALHSHRKEDDAQGERICKEGIVRGRRVHLRCLVGRLATQFKAAYPRGCRHAEVDELDLRRGALGAREHDVLEREVPVGNAGVVEPPHGAEELQGNGQHRRLALRPRRRAPEAPGKEVALRRKRRHSIEVLRVGKDALQLAHKWGTPVVELLQDGKVKPRLL
mmetsp:Transcript_85234/g.241521  ORF Transcript_85234/g.241521 Transcript_85234/m.241521 type:complete len:276 (+) Transcript_85234:196-1023(+)